MEKQERKPNRLGCYDYGNMGCYFVTMCTQKRARLFEMELPPVPGEENTGTTHWSFPTNAIIHEWINVVQMKYPNIRVDRYVIMPDHVHLLVTITEEIFGSALPDVMRFFKTMTTNAYIRGVKAGCFPPFEGKLWQKSYYDHVIRNRQDYEEVWEYIENNPAKWIYMHTP